MFNQALVTHWRLGTVADPGPELLLDKTRLAKLRIKKVDFAIQELKQQIDILVMERDMLKRTYKIK